jgi:hypothetical protein
VLTVPGQYPGIQAAMDASAPGDTVHVAPGTWYGLYTSPTHSLTLCSDYLFTQDSTDINETILDGEYAGTILDLVCENEWFILCGFTLQHGMGQQVDIYTYCHRAGALQINGYVNAEVRDIVFRENRAPRMAPVLYRGTVCTVATRPGDLILRNIACYGNTIENQIEGSADAILIRLKESVLVIDGLYYDGDGGEEAPFYIWANFMESVNLNDIRIFDSRALNCEYSGVVTNESGHSFSNLLLSGQQGFNSCEFWIQPTFHGVTASTATFRNLQAVGHIGRRSFVIGNRTSTTLEIDSLTVQECRFQPAGVTGGVEITSTRPGSLRNVHFHHNTSGDSVSQVAKSLLYTENINIDGASFHDNRAIVAADPEIGSTYGHYVGGAMLQVGGSHVVLQNMEFVNNRVDDLDDYSDHSPAQAYQCNAGREIYAQTSGSLRVRNIQVSNSRQPNHCPEVYSNADIDLARPGSTLTLYSNKLYVDSVVVEDADDGGLAIGGDSLWATNVILRDVGRVGLWMPRRENPSTPPYYSFRNILIEDVDAVDNFLTPSYQHLTNQAALFIDVRSDYNDIDPVVNFENVTVTGCDGMRHLFNFYEPVDLRVRNCLFWSNTYEQLARFDNAGTETWEFNMLEEEVPGIGNEVGYDPLFDEELGAPWLSTISPAIDAGHPNTRYNDREDSNFPGFTAWPSQGTLRNDIGYTGGPYAGTLDHLVAVRKPVTDPPAQPAVFTLHPAYPNPFNPSTTLSYTLDHPMQIELSVYNLLGQQVRTLAFGLQEAGEHSVPFTAGEMASGVYFVRLEAGGRAETQKVVLIR